MESLVENNSTTNITKLGVAPRDTGTNLVSGNRTSTSEQLIGQIGLTTCTVIAVIGALGNLCTFVFISCSRKTRTPTYIVIASMALADFLSLCGFYAYDLGILFAETTKLSYGYFCYHVGLLGETFRHASMTQIVLLSGLRYLITVHPLKSRRYLTTKRTLFVCAGLWLFSGLFGVVVLTVQLTINGQTPIDELGHSINEKYFNMTNIVYYLSVPTIFIGVFYMLKLRGLKATSLTSTNQHIARMTKMTGIVIIAYLVTVTPFYVFNLAADLFEDTFWLYLALHVTNILYYINYSINPLIYFYFSPACRDIRIRKEKKKKEMKYPSYVSSISGKIVGQKTHPVLKSMSAISKSSCLTEVESLP